MTVYFNNFSQYPTGTAPDDWTWQIHDPGGTVSVNESADALSGKLLRIEHGWHFQGGVYAWDPIAEDPDSGDVEILARFRMPSPGKAYTTWVVCGDAATKDFYSDGDRNNTSSGKIVRWDGGTPTAIAQNTTAKSNGVWYWIQVRRNGTAIKSRIWADGDPKPAAWTVETTDATYLQSGFVGLMMSNGSADTSIIEIDQFGVGTAGDAAPAEPASQHFWTPNPADLGGPPAGWTNLYGTTTLTVKQDGDGRYYLELNGTSNTRSAVTLDEIDGVDVTDLGDLEISAEVEYGADDKIDCRQLMKFTGTSNATAKCWAGGVHNSSDPGNAESMLIRQESGGLAAQGSVDKPDLMPGDPFHQRSQSIGTHYRTKAWEGGVGSEPAGWDVDLDSTLSFNERGGIGFIRYWAAEARIYSIGLGLGGAPAPIEPLGGGGTTYVEPTAGLRLLPGTYAYSESEPVVAADHNIAFDFRVSSTTGINPLVFLEGDSSNGRNVGVYIHNGELKAYTDAGGVSSAVLFAGILADTWYRLVFSTNAGEFTAFLDDSASGSYVALAGDPGALLNRVTLGRIQHAGATEYATTVTMDLANVTIWPSPLLTDIPADRLVVQDIMDSAVPMDGLSGADEVWPLQADGTQDGAAATAAYGPMTLYTDNANSAEFVAFGDPGETGQILESAFAGSTITAICQSPASISGPALASDQISASAAVNMAIIGAVSAGDSTTDARAALQSIQHGATGSETVDAIATAAAAVSAGAAAGEDWVNQAQAVVDMLGQAVTAAQFSAAVDASIQAAIAEQSYASAAFLNAINGIAELEGNASVSDAFVATVAYVASISAGATAGASFDLDFGFSAALNAGVISADNWFVISSMSAAINDVIGASAIVTATASVTAAIQASVVARAIFSVVGPAGRYLVMGAVTLTSALQSSIRVDPALQDTIVIKPGL